MNTYAKLYLALLGQFPWRYLPTVPIEIVLMPRWFFFDIYEVSSWSRAMLMPLAILNHFKPTKQLPPDQQLHELYPIPVRKKAIWACAGSGRKLSPGPISSSSVTACSKAMHAQGRGNRGSVRRWKASRGLDDPAHGGGERWAGGDFPGDAEFAHRAEGRCSYSREHPLYVKAKRDFEGLFVDDPQDFRIQPCLSPVWDTA